ncbi:putative CRAL/TRIO domain-containing protein [Operophtera brumata]|uniref:Putative CRAL/TRIO domain-containing protein n=1 Tax=Operophtera brumata TaxID=104452 RepID=A0A0L7LS19_OPEBR|nr:putative CRAL/TRIO domain-containing protein [Operophtera brumata]
MPDSNAIPNIVPTACSFFGRDTLLNGGLLRLGGSLCGIRHLVEPLGASITSIKETGAVSIGRVIKLMMTRLKVVQLRRAGVLRVAPPRLSGRVQPFVRRGHDWFEVLSSEEHEKHLAEMKASNTDESLRTPDKFNEQIMGLPGSFRTLTVD